MKDVRYPWIILVPRKPGLIEISDLSRQDRIALSDETEIAARAIRELYNPFKLNIGTLGNIVTQLHIHILGRTECDPAWPGPVWGHSPAEAYTPETLDMRVQEVRDAISVSIPHPSDLGLQSDQKQ